MSLDGVWDAVVKSPLGPQKSTLNLMTEGGVLSGESVPETGAPMVLQNGKIEGEKVSWTLDVTTPMKMKVIFEATLAGDTLDGIAKPGMFGKFPFTAQKRP